MKNLIFIKQLTIYVIRRLNIGKANFLPDGFQNIPGFDKIIEKIAEDAISPLEEITLIQEESKKIINE